MPENSGESGTGALVGAAVAVLIGLGGIVGTTLGLIAGKGDGRMMVVAFAPWGDRDADRSALWAAGAPIAAEWIGSTFVVDTRGLDAAALEALPALLLPLAGARPGCTGSPGIASPRNGSEGTTT